jgi:hypothetical protein
MNPTNSVPAASGNGTVSQNHPDRPRRGDSLRHASMSTLGSIGLLIVMVIIPYMPLEGLYVKL